jgi:hypothetical protein
VSGGAEPVAHVSNAWIGTTGWIMREEGIGNALDLRSGDARAGIDPADLRWC